MTDLDLCYLPISEAARLIKSRSLSPVELMRVVVARLKDVEPKINAFIHVYGEHELDDRARVAEQEIARGVYRGPLHGLPITIKDLYDIAGTATTCASAARFDHMAAEHAFAVQRLLDAGAIILGKTNLTEFAVDLPGPRYGWARNPWDLDRIPGFSSSGSGAALSAGVGFATMGSDTGGSIRIPAAFSSCVGIKPTYGRVSRRGIFPLAWSLDHAGPLARTVEGAAAALNVVAGYDPQDPTSSRGAVPLYTAGLERGVKKLRVGVPWADLDESVEPGVRKLFDDAIATLRGLGAEVRDVTLPHFRHTWTALGAIIRTEQAAAHATLIRSRRHLYGKSLGDRIAGAMLRPAVQYIEAQRLRTLIKRDFDAVLEKVDVIATPTIPIWPYRIDANVSGGAGEGALTTKFTTPSNLTGLPAISVPCGFGPAGDAGEGLPAGLQLVGRAFEEALLFRAAHAYEQATEWHTMRPPL